MLRRTLSVSTLIGAILLAVSQAWAQGEVFQHNFRWCGAEDPDYEYALCAASTCTPLPGVEIAVNTVGGGTANFPAAQCTCPIFKGLALADVSGGNMTGTCDPPPNNGVWSLYFPTGQIPQEINDWSKGKKQSAAPIFVCSADLNQGTQFANCFSFACARAGKVKGNIEVATCTCPLGESLEGKQVSAHSEFTTPAGQCNVDICFQHPVGAPFPFDDQAPGQCFSF
jgi:hypothetical protein